MVQFWHCVWGASDSNVSRLSIENNRHQRGQYSRMVGEEKYGTRENWHEAVGSAK